MYFQFLLNGVELSPENLHSIRLSGVAELSLRADYGAAMRRPHADLPLSERGGGEYLRLRTRRRSDLEAIVRTGISAENRTKALDIICAVCEEPSWAETIPGPFDDDAHPHIDLMAADTALIMAWALHEGDFVPNVRARMLRELRRRIFTPLIAHDDYACMQPDAPRALAVLCNIIIAAALTERDHTRLVSLLRRIVPAADAVISVPNIHPLKDALADWTHAAAAWRSLRTMAGPQPITRQLPLPMWLDTVLFSHLGNGVFADKSGKGIINELNGADIYYLGKCAGDDAVEALGAYIWQQAPGSISALAARLTCDHTMDMTSNTEGAPRFRHAALNDMSIMSARGGGTSALIHTGGCANAGGICAYVDDIPVLLACSPDSLLIDGKALTNVPGTGDGEFDDDRADMSVDITPALPEGSAARFMQRTLMLDRESGMLRIIDMIECTRGCELAYNFLTSKPPERIDGVLRVGPAEVTLEGGVDPVISRTDGGSIFPGGLYRMNVTYNLVPGSNMVNIVVAK